MEEELLEVIDCEVLLHEVEDGSSSDPTGQGKKRYKCDVCDFVSNHSCNLNRHKLIHTGERPYKCNICDSAFKQLSHLKQHKLIHTGEKPYKCNICDYASKQCEDLKRHKFIHTGEKPYRCDVCDYACNHSRNLKRHKRVHYREPGASITQTGKKKRQQSSLVENLSTKISLHRCVDCNYYTKSVSRLQYHLSQHSDFY